MRPALHWGVQGWLGDFFRMLWALFYWNTRKSLYRARGTRGQCPCQNPSDSGRPYETGCEAVLGWRQPARFRRVCPLLARNEKGGWVCSVAAPQVRPFWGRVAGYFGLSVLVGVMLVGLLSFGFLRTVGYQVSARQIFWPPAWRELREVRARLFIEQARKNYAAGNLRDAMLALGVAQEMDPRNYQVGRTLADFYQVAGSPLVDETYSRLLREHPEHRTEVARAWFKSLLPRGRMEEIAVLARLQLESETTDVAAWTNAVIFAAQKRARPAWLDEKNPAPPAASAARAAIALAKRVLTAPEAAVRRDLLVQTPLTAQFPYDRVYRIEQLLQAGYTLEAGSLLAISREQLSGADIARLTLAMDATSGNVAQLRTEFNAFFLPGRKVKAAEFELLAIHLINYPDRELLALMLSAKDRIDGEPLEARAQALIALFCAAGRQRDRSGMEAARTKIKSALGTPQNILNQLEAFFLREQGAAKIEQLLPNVFPLSPGLNYALLNRY